MRSIRSKLAILVLTTVAAAVLLVAFAFAWIDLNQRFDAKEKELQGIAATIAAAVSRPLAAGDADSVGRTLSAVGRMPGLTYARVTDATGRTVHQFGFGIVIAREAGGVEPNADIGPFTALYLATYPVAAPVISGGVGIGEVTLIGDLSSLRGALARSVLSALVAAALATTLGLLLSRRLQRSITRPVAKLKYAMQDIARTKDFDRVVEKTSQDEISELVDAFNGMLGEVRTRDLELARHRDRLEIEVADRTAELSEAKCAAEAASAAKSDFLATMSHEIRTPLNGMLVVAELMATADLPARERRYAEVLATSGQTLLAIINDILDFSKIEAGKLVLERLPVAPRRIVDDVMALFAARADSRGLTLDSRIADDVPQWISADPVRLTQILSNLVGNALKFTEQGGVRIVLDVAMMDRRDRAVMEFSVEDTGIGIPADKLATIFEAFSQADQSTSRRFGGTGIGLTICQRLADAMGGTISATSDMGRGSRFTLRVPVDLATAPDKAAATAAAAEPALSLRGLRVLAADDNAINREMLVEAVARLGAEIVCVEDGQAAVSAYAAGTYDVVLMDCSMPVLDGYAATRLIRADEAESGRRPVPIVALTAHVLGEQTGAWREAGMTGHLAKPYTLKALRACLAAAAGREAAASPGASQSSPSIAGRLLIDHEVLGGIAEMQAPGDDLVARVVRLYAEHAPRTLERLLNVAGSGDATAVAAAAHALRSLSRNIGAIEIGDLCTRLEAEARSGDLDHVEAHCAALQAALPATIAALTLAMERHRESPVPAMQQASA